MSLLYPTVMLERVSDITPGLLKRLGVKALLLDVDNTLATHNGPEPAPGVLEWLDLMRAAGILVCLASNNGGRRVNAFATALRADCVARSLKPLPVGFFRAAKRLGLPARRFAVVGDQIFTDVLGGNLFGAKTILLKPLKPENGSFFRIKRRMETGIIQRYRNKKIGRKGIKHEAPPR